MRRKEAWIGIRRNLDVGSSRRPVEPRIICLTKTKIFHQNLGIQATPPSPQSYAIDMFHRMSKRHTFIRWRNLPTPVGATVSTETMYLVRMTNGSERRSRRALRGIEYSPREYTEFHCLTRARAPSCALTVWGYQDRDFPTGSTLLGS